MNQRYIITRDRKRELEMIIRSLPGVLSGRLPDPHRIAYGFKSRLAHTFFMLVAHAYEQKGRGQVGDDGITWAPLSAQYLAYVRPTTTDRGRKPPKGGKLAPGGNDGLLTKEQLKLWNRTFADRYAWFVMRESDASAKAHAAAIAWIVVKAAGGKTKLQKFGSRVAGVDYQILVDVGNLRRSLMPGQLTNRDDVDSGYIAPSEQLVDDRGSTFLVGTKDPKAVFHHNGKGRMHRPLWPETLPADWWRQIEDAALGGLTRIGELVGGRAA